MRHLTIPTFEHRDTSVSRRSDRNWMLPGGRKPVLLVIDDDEDTRNMLRVLFESDGFTVAECCEGDDALTEIAAAQPDLIVLDGRLRNGEDGWSICRRLRSSAGPFRHVPVIFISAAVTAESAALAFEAGCNLYFPKPFDIYQLLFAAKELLSMFERVH
jgi:two-component system, OmpR family, phosphate regulon response regulator PhoB